MAATDRLRRHQAGGDGGPGGRGRPDRGGAGRRAVPAAGRATLPAGLVATPDLAGWVVSGGGRLEYLRGLSTRTAPRRPGPARPARGAVGGAGGGRPAHDEPLVRKEMRGPVNGCQDHPARGSGGTPLPPRVGSWLSSLSV